jgi:hypothetical protein
VAIVSFVSIVVVGVLFVFVVAVECFPIVH